MTSDPSRAAYEPRQADGQGSTDARPAAYQPHVGTLWWVGRWSYTFFVLREISALLRRTVRDSLVDEAKEG